MQAGRRVHLKPMAAAGVAAAVASLMLWMMPSVPAHAAGTPTTYVIGVDNTPPAGHGFEYIDFFPRTGVNVHNGDILDFKIPAGADPDGMHIIGLLKQGVTVNQAFADPANALVVPDSDDPGANPLENLSIFGGSSPPPGSGAPGACGDQATPCTYDGTAQIWSGSITAGTDYFVKLALTSGFTGSVTVVDFGHPIADPSATINVVADSATASTQSDLNTAAASQAQSDTAGALAAEAAASQPKVTANPDGSHTYNVHVGASTQFVEIMAMLPSSIKIAPGDHITWTTGSTSEPHTVQFPSEQSFPVDPFDLFGQCEGASGDTPPPQPNMGPPNFGCPSGVTPEESLIPPARGTATIHSPSYRLAGSDGGVFDFGQSAYHGTAATSHPASPIVAISSTGDQGGYYEVTAGGGVYTFGDARFFGSAAGKVSAPIVGMLTDPLNEGYLLVGADGKFYSFGPDVPPIPAGQVPAHLAAPIVGMAPAPSQNGLAVWLVAADGGVFAVNGAPFIGSLGSKHLNAPIVGIASTPDDGGFWLVGKDGGVFSFGDATFHGSTGSLKLVAPVVAIMPTPSGNGYWLAAKDGGIFSFGDATFHGSMGGKALRAPIVSIDGSYSLGTSGILLNVPAGNPNALPSRTSYTYTFPDRGDYNFICGFHATMQGTVTVG